MTAADAAWLAALPCAALIASILVLLGPPLGSALLPDPGIPYLDSIRPEREPTEQMRYLLALLGPLLLAAAVVAVDRRRLAARASTVTTAVLGVQIVAAAFVVTCFVAQRSAHFGLGRYRHTTVYFTLATLVAAVAIAALVLAAAQRDGIRRWLSTHARETRSLRIAAVAIAVVATASWFATTVHFDATVGVLHQGVRRHLPFTMNDAWAVLDGRSPLVDYTPQYSMLWPYPIAAVMALAGPSVGSYSVTLAVVSVFAMLSVYFVLRRVARSSAAALALFLPVVAMSGYMMEGPLQDRYAVTSLPSMYPLRYAGPLALLWLTARHLDRAWPRNWWPLFAVAGVVLLNNAEFGVPALGATIAALLWGGSLTRARAGRAGAEAAIGFVIAYALVAALTLVRAGALPDLGALTLYPRIYGVGGFGTYPMSPVVGVALVLYLTYAAAIVTATVRRRQPGRSKLLTGLLAWAGTFGLGIGSYYMGRSHPQVLTNMFGAWALCTALLTIVALRSYLASGRRLPTPAEAACVIAFAISVCALAQWPTPWSQVDRLQQTTRPIFHPPFGQRFIADNTGDGEPVVLLMRMGHRIAYNLGLDNVSPYMSPQLVFTEEQLADVVEALRAAGGSKVFFTWFDTDDAAAVRLQEMGFSPVRLDRRRWIYRFDAPWAP